MIELSQQRIDTLTQASNWVSRTIPISWYTYSNLWRIQNIIRNKQYTKDDVYIMNTLVSIWKEYECLSYDTVRSIIETHTDGAMKNRFQMW